jgi:hypothetical protein
MKNNLKIGVISVIGLLTLTVISAMTINSVPVVNAAKGGSCDGNCKNEAYGNLISDEAQAGKANPNDNNKNGYGDEVSPLARDSDGDGENGDDGGMGKFRESGVDARDNNGNGPGQSDEAHGNDD